MISLLKKIPNVPTLEKKQTKKLNPELSNSKVLADVTSEIGYGQVLLKFFTLQYYKNLWG